MTDYQSNVNEGVLFRNNDKKTDKHPDYSGSWTDANGVEYWLNAWINTSKSGSKYMKVKLGNSKGEQIVVNEPKALVPEGATVTESEDIPF